MKKVLLAVSLLTVLCLLSSCMMISGSGLESMFGSSSADLQPLALGKQMDDGETVTISREEYLNYQRLQKFSELADLYEDAEKYFFREPDTEKMMEYAAKGLLAGLDDPYTFYYSPEEFQKMLEDDEGRYVGIGVMILSDFNEDTCVISRVFKGGPAEEAGVMRGDILYRVGEDLYVTPENVNEAVNIMRGEPDTSVDVTFMRDGEEITFNIVRREIQVNQVESTMLEPGIGYIALYEFAGEADKEFESALDELTEQGIDGLIIDLRDNSGGWVLQAQTIGDLFMDAGDLCYLVYRDGSEEHLYRTRDGKTDVKLVVLVNEMSASSSEILTGALRECAGAVTVGIKSFGKGIIQGVYDVGSNGAGYQLTIAH